MDVLDMEKVTDHRLCLVYFVKPGEIPPFNTCLCGLVAIAQSEMRTFSFNLLF